MGRPARPDTARFTSPLPFRAGPVAATPKIGTNTAFRPPASAPLGASRKPQREEEPIRTLGVSLVAVAAIVASLTVVRQRQEVRGDKEVRPGPSPTTVDIDLDGLRAAGF
ncbi:hypothetical protein BH23GEM4_BH23GEM4_13950 [soil metagenome]